MSQSQSFMRSQPRVSVADLRKQIPVFSFQHRDSPKPSILRDTSLPDLAIRPGSIVECLVPAPGSGAMTAALQILICSQQANGYWAILEPHGQSYLPALTGWGIDPQKLLFVRPNSRDQSSWAIEQCLRSQGLSVTLAWVLDRFPAKVHRRWQMAAEAGGGIGLVFRPLSAQREPIWADLRLQLTPSPAGSEAKRRLEIEVLYRRGGLAIQSQAWEIDHAAGHVHLVS